MGSHVLKSPIPAVSKEGTVYMDWQHIMEHYSTAPQKWNIYRDKLVKVEHKNKKRIYETYVGAMDTKPIGIFCPCCHNTFATTDAYLHHKAIQVMKEERRRQREEAEAERRRMLDKIRQNQKNSLGRFLKHNRYSMTHKLPRTFNPSYGAGASGIAGGVSIAPAPYNPPYKTAPIKKKRLSEMTPKQEIFKIPMRPPNSRQCANRHLGPRF